MSATKQSIALCATILLFTVATAVQGERVWLNSGGSHQIEQDYEAHNIFIVNGTNVTLENGSITAPDSGDNGEDAVRVEDATFHAVKGMISGGLGIGGTGVTISTSRNSDLPPGTATFESGVEVKGGDATRAKTTKGGDAVTVLHKGSLATFNGGKFVPGLGCTMKVCGTTNDNGVAVRVVEGKAVVKGGLFEGSLYNVGGDIEVHGCVVYDKDTQKISGVLLDGSNIDVNYEGQNKPPIIVYQSEVCPQVAPDSPSSSARRGLALISSSFILIMSFIIFLQ